MVVYFKANTINTGAATLNVNSLGAKTIVKYVNTTLENGDIAAGMFCSLIYDGTNFVLQNPIARPAITQIQVGTTTKDSADASTTQNIAHGLGIIPKFVKIFAMPQVNNELITTNAQSIAITSYNGSTQTSLSNWNTTATGGKYAQDDGATGAGSFTLNHLTQSGSTTTQTGVVTFDATNIIITWTKTGSPSGVYDFMWEAYA
jgi:hypothetical protein